MRLLKRLAVFRSVKLRIKFNRLKVILFSLFVIFLYNVNCSTIVVSFAKFRTQVYCLVEVSYCLSIFAPRTIRKATVSISSNMLGIQLYRPV